MTSLSGAALTKRYGDPDAYKIDRYLRSGGYEQARRALGIDNGDVQDAGHLFPHGTQDEGRSS